MNHEKTKWCNGCDRWLSAREIYDSPHIVPIGMAFVGSRDDEAYYYFLHDIEECGTTFLISTKEFESFLAEDVPADNLHGTECCENYCSSVDTLAICHEECQFAPYRRLLFDMMAAKQRATAPDRQDVEDFLNRQGILTEPTEP